MRTEIEVNFIRLCAYCRKKQVIRKVTCGDSLCQHKHHIVACRRNRKTKQVRTTRLNIQDIV